VPAPPAAPTNAAVVTGMRLISPAIPEKLCVVA